MGIGGFLYRNVIPLTGNAIGISGHTVKEARFIFGYTFHDTVDHCHGFRPGDFVVGLKGTIFVTGDPTVAAGQFNVFLWFW